MKTHPLATQLLAGLVGLAMIPAIALAQDAGGLFVDGVSTQQPAGDLGPLPQVDLIVRDAVVLLYDGVDKSFNGMSIFDASVPAAGRRKRPAAGGTARDKPTPLGLITFAGSPVASLETSIVPSKALRPEVMSVWPRATTRQGAVTWMNLPLQPSTGQADLSLTWLGETFSKDRLAILAGEEVQNAAGTPIQGRQQQALTAMPGDGRFAPGLIYDIAMHSDPPLTLERKGEQYVASLASGAKLTHLTLIQPVDGGWRLATATPPDKATSPDADADANVVAEPEPAADPATGEGEAAPSPTPAADDDDAQPAMVSEYTVRAGDTLAGIAQALLKDRSRWKELVQANPDLDPLRMSPGMILALPEPVLAALANAETQTESSELPLLETKVAVSLDDKVYETPQQAASVFTEQLRVAGMEDVEIRHVLSILEATAFGQKQAIVVAQLSGDRLEELLPLTVRPQPQAIHRVGLVVFRSIDPNLPATIKALIEELGQPSWARREKAAADLKAYGEAAIPHLQNATKHSNAEVAFRVEVLLAELKPPTRK